MYCLVSLTRSVETTSKKSMVTSLSCVQLNIQRQTYQDCRDCFLVCDDCVEACEEFDRDASETCEILGSDCQENTPDSDTDVEERTGL